ncbi:MAG: hypothetical protein HKN81_10210 [Gammaproteobacteria bacterium]|nr:hypothetical protein [Gammaproteobacteria bacterium]
MTVKRSYLIAAIAVLLMNLSPLQAAEQDTVQAVIPWEAEGRVFQVGPTALLFLGALEGIMYIESSRGELHEAFVMCPIVQELDIGSGKTEAEGHCEITAGAEDVVFATMTCKGEVGSCEGSFTLTGGEGEFAGISGSGDLRVRSPIRTLVADMAAGAVLRVGAGLAAIKDLKYRIP